MRATAARIDALQDAPGLKHETAEALEAGQPFGLLQDAGMPTARMDEAGDDNADPTAEAEPAAPAETPADPPLASSSGESINSSAEADRLRATSP